MGLKKKILVISPKFPYPAVGACEQDRAAGIELFKKMGWETRILTKVYSDWHKTEAMAAGEKLGVQVTAVVYKHLFKNSLWRRLVSIVARVVQPWYLDGAAYEYADPEIRAALGAILNEFKPDVVWVDYTYLWPLYGDIQKKNIPIITRSINFEPRHFLEEEGRTVINYIKFLPKLLSEFLTSRKSNVMCAITPDEAKMYDRLGARRVVSLPLRGLPRCLNAPRAGKTNQPLKVFFSGSTYNVAHNRSALEFLLTKVIPLASSQFPGQFEFNIFGGKIPSDLEIYFSGNCIKHGYVEAEAFEKMMSDMDIAIMPSLYGAGMQQKVFEPLARGFPVITSARALAGYRFANQDHLLVAHTADEVVKALGILRNAEMRSRVGGNANRQARQLFSGEIIERLVSESLVAALG